MQILEHMEQVGNLVICVDDGGYAPDLEKWGVYEVLPDESLGSGFMRIVDGSGEDYLYPATMFESIELQLRHEYLGATA